MSRITRREFVQTSAGLVISFYLPGRPVAARAPTAAPFAPNAWLRIGTDGIITLTLDKSEMGRGSRTGPALILAEELEADWSTVRLGPLPENPAAWSRTMRTGGSNAIRSSWQPLRKAGATAREMLVTAAAQTWQVDRATCRAEQGAVIHVPTGRRLRYGTLAARAAALPVPSEAPVKDPKDFRLVGTRVTRLDTPGKVDGSAVFGIDVKVPEMLVASIERSPVLGGRVKRFDADRAKAIPGVRHVVELEASSWMSSKGGGWAAGCAAGVAVVADTYWQAVEARRALVIEWDEGEASTLDSASIRAQLVALAERSGVVAQTIGDGIAAVANAATRVFAEYDVPFVHHATMEPMNCTAFVRSDGCDVWAPTQNQGDAQRVAAEVTGLPKEKVRIHTTLSGGGFGRRLEPDFVSEAVRVSHNGFVTECFLDEVAAAGGRDPFELRRELLRDKPRHLRTLELAAEKAGWGSSLPQGHARGIALAEWGPTVCVEVAEVSVDADGSVHVPRVVCAVDCGQTVNTGQIEAQMQGGVVFGLSAALYGEITLARGRVVQGNFDTYPVVRMPEAPAVEVYIVPSSDPQGGAGEPGVPPIAPAVCNAIFAATGKRIRKLPIGRVVV